MAWYSQTSVMCAQAIKTCNEIVFPLKDLIDGSQTYVLVQTTFVTLQKTYFKRTFHLRFELKILQKNRILKLTPLYYFNIVQIHRYITFIPKTETSLIYIVYVLSVNKKRQLFFSSFFIARHFVNGERRLHVSVTN